MDERRDVVRGDPPGRAVVRDELRLLGGERRTREVVEHVVRPEDRLAGRGGERLGLAGRDTNVRLLEDDVRLRDVGRHGVGDPGELRHVHDDVARRRARAAGAADEPAERCAAEYAGATADERAEGAADEKADTRPNDAARERADRADRAVLVAGAVAALRLRWCGRAGGQPVAAQVVRPVVPRRLGLRCQVLVHALSLTRPASGRRRRSGTRHSSA